MDNNLAREDCYDKSTELSGVNRTPERGGTGAWAEFSGMPCTIAWQIYFLLVIDVQLSALKLYQCR
jgi:hypothetical protein